MKMMMSTSSTSIIGVTLISALCPLPPTFPCGGVAFASELKSFLVLDEFPREVDPRAMVEYTQCGVPGVSDAFFRNMIH